MIANGENNQLLFVCFVLAFLLQVCVFFFCLRDVAKHSDVLKSKNEEHGTYLSEIEVCL